MSWVQIAPPMICCGRPPCPICYRWSEPNGQTIPAIERMSIDLWGIAWRELTQEKKTELETFANKLHESPIVVTPSEPVEPVAPAGTHFEMRALELKLKSLRKAPEPPPRVLSVDEIEDRKQAKKDREAAEKKAEAERLKPLREFAREMAKVQQETRPVADPYESIRGIVPTEFIEMGRSRGMSPREVRYEFEKYNYSGPRFEPNWDYNLDRPMRKP